MKKFVVFVVGVVLATGLVCAPAQAAQSSVPTGVSTALSSKDKKFVAAIRRAVPALKGAKAWWLVSAANDLCRQSRYAKVDPLRFLPIYRARWHLTTDDAGTFIVGSMYTYCQDEYYYWFG